MSFFSKLPPNSGALPLLGFLGAAGALSLLDQGSGGTGSAGLHPFHRPERRPPPMPPSTRGSCSLCGDRIGRHGSRTKAEDKMRAKISNLGSHLYQQRFDQRANFAITMAQRNRLNAQRVVRYRQAFKEALVAMGAVPSKVKFHRSRLSAVSAAGRTKATRLDWRPAMAGLAEAQAILLQRMGVGPLKEDSRLDDPLHPAPVEPLMSLKLYGEEKNTPKNIATRRKPGSTAADYEKVAPLTLPRSQWVKGRSNHRKDSGGVFVFYVASLYAERAWTIYVLQQTGFADRTRRMAAYATKNAQGQLQPGVLSALTVVLGLPEPVPTSQPGGAYQVIPATSWQLNKDGTNKPHAEIQPRLFIFNRQGEQMVIYNVGGSGGMSGFATGNTGTKMFTQTSKMSAPSFSLPAGEPATRGTCVFAGMASQKTYGDDLFICRKCYATGANYAYANAMLASGMRMRWCIQQIEAAGKKGDRLAAGLIAALYSYARDAKLSERETQEIGIWNARSEELTYRVTKGGAAGINPKWKPAGKQQFRQGRTAALQGRKMSKQQLKQAPLRFRGGYNSVPQRKGLALTRFDVQRREQVGLPANITSTTAWFKSLDVPNRAVAGFFRIHDSGDLSLPAGQDAYIAAWARVVEAYPYVSFWCPTRIWARPTKIINYAGKVVIKPGPQAWLEAGYKAGLRIGSAAIRKALKGGVRRLLGRGMQIVAQVPPQLDPDDAILQGGDDLLLESQGAPGEAEAQITGAGGSDFTYTPSPGTVKKLVALTARFSNFALRPSALYVKTTENPAFIPFVTLPVGAPDKTYNGRPYGKGSNALPAGTGVNTKWGNDLNGGRAVALQRGEDPLKYVPVFDNRGRQAFQCPVYSEEAVKMKNNKPVIDANGEPEMIEAVSCQQAGCRACWLALDQPITYGYH